MGSVYPKGGWGRAARYVRHRLHRLPGSPETIARGIWAGVFTCFTPFYGLHFVIAVVLARIMQGNMLAALLGTFFGNPLTYVPIAVVSLTSGNWMMGTEAKESTLRALPRLFVDAGGDLKHNFLALFTDERADWHNLGLFYDEVFYPYMIGGIVPGIIAASVCYYLAVPVIRAYQKRRRGVLAAKFAALKKKPARTADEGRKGK